MMKIFLIFLRGRLNNVPFFMCWVTTLIIGLRVFKYILKWSGQFGAVVRPEASLWIGLLVFCLFHLAVWMLAFLYRRIFTQVSLVFLYINLQLLFYFLFLIKSFIFLGLSDQYWWIIILCALFLPALMIPVPKKEDLSTTQDFLPLYGKVLMLLWMVSSLFLWTIGNFYMERKTYGDEGTFWVTAAEHMVKDGIHRASMISYPGGGLHPFGVPFMAAAPLTLSGWQGVWSIYCFPLVSIFSLGLWLFSRRWQRWSLVFFMAALLASFSNQSWVGQLMYQLTFAESISAVLLLIVVSEMGGLLVKSEKLYGSTVLLLSGSIGLLSLTKSPLNTMVLPLEGTVLWIFFRYHRPSINIALLLSSILLSLMPWALVSLYAHYYHVSCFGQDANGLSKIIERLLHPNIPLLSACLKNMWFDDQKMAFFVFLSMVMLIFTRFRRVLMIPVGIFLMGWLFYYAYLYHYPNTGDYGSSVRYLMTIVLALYWMASLVYQDFMDSCASKGWMGRLVQLVSISCLIMMFF